MCKRARRTLGTAEREASVAHLLASEARRDRTRPRVSRAAETPLYAFSRAIDRESLAGLGNSLKLISFKMLDIPFENIEGTMTGI